MVINECIRIAFLAVVFGHVVNGLGTSFKSSEVSPYIKKFEKSSSPRLWKKLLIVKLMPNRLLAFCSLSAKLCHTSRAFISLRAAALHA